jgi:hypothetical protein
MRQVNIITFYSSALFQSAGHSVTKAAWFSLGEFPEDYSIIAAVLDCSVSLFFSLSNDLTGFGITNFVATFPVYKRIDSPSYGRRWLLLFSLFGTTFSLLVTGQFFRINDDVVRIGLVAAGVIIFGFFYSIGGPIPFTLSAEAASLAYRGNSMLTAASTMSLAKLLSYRSFNVF